MPIINFYIHPFFLIPVTLAIGFAVGVIVGFFSYSKAVQIELRKRMEYERYDLKAINRLAESRREKRRQYRDILVSIKAPVLDTAGIPALGENVIFAAELLDLSRHGMAVLSPYYIPKGVDIETSCYDKKISFPYRPAKIRYTILTPKGLRIGMQFFKPLDIV